MIAFWIFSGFVVGYFVAWVRIGWQQVRAHEALGRLIRSCVRSHALRPLLDLADRLEGKGE